VIEINSPIEKMFLKAGITSRYPIVVRLEGDRVVRFNEVPNDCLILLVEPQKRVGAYRIDFAMEMVLKRSVRVGPALAIECDGFEYHSSKEQMRRDKQRDRWLMANGYRVVRFAGTEIWSDPVGCFREALHALEWQI